MKRSVAAALLKADLETAFIEDRCTAAGICHGIYSSKHEAAQMRQTKNSQILWTQILEMWGNLPSTTASYSPGTFLHLQLCSTWQVDRLQALIIVTGAVGDSSLHDGSTNTATSSLASSSQFSSEWACRSAPRNQSRHVEAWGPLPWPALVRSLESRAEADSKPFLARLQQLETNKAAVSGAGWLCLHAWELETSLSVQIWTGMQADRADAGHAVLLLALHDWTPPQSRAFHR